MPGGNSLRWQQMVFDQRVVDSYKTGNIDYIDVLLGSGDFNDMVNRVQLPRRTGARRQRPVGELTAARDAVAAEKQDVAAKTLKARRLRDQVKQQHDELARLRAEKLVAQKSTQPPGEPRRTHSRR